MTPLNIGFENGEKKESDIDGKMEEYQDKLVKAVLDEDYEYAAFLRDRIRDLGGKDQR
jgi:protein-arginine kinase activator protein McsA